MSDVRSATLTLTPTPENIARVTAYLPSGYAISPAHAWTTDTPTPEPRIRIYGFDRAGWTLTDYVLPRLASGMIFGREDVATAE